MKKKQTSKADLLASVWEAYENGKDFKRQIGLYSRVSENERFYRGDQWKGVSVEGLPTPTFNLIRRVVNYLVSAIMNYRMDLRYEDPSADLREDSPAKRKLAKTLSLLSDYRADCWERQGIDRLLRQALTDSILCGDGVFYAWYDENLLSADGHPGDIRLSVIDNVNLFAADMNLSDIQSQDFILLSGRCGVDKLRKEALFAGCSPEQAARIVPDEADGDQAGDYGSMENADESAAKADYLIRFSRNADGYVVFEKCTKNLVIRSAVTGLRRYPVATFSWERTKNCFHGSSPISELIGNQKYINKAFAMEMKHMTDTAFSKVIYDKRLIPEWSNEVGQAIGVLSGGDVSGAVTTVGVGQMQEGYIDIIDRVITYTKELAGATETALGEVDPTNTSAIITLRETADQPLDNVRSEFCHCLEELAMIWLEMEREYLPAVRRVSDRKEIAVLNLGDRNLSHLIARAQTGASRRYSGTLQMSTLNSLLSGGHISLSQYLMRLPDGIIPDKELLLEEAIAKEKEEKSNGKRTTKSDADGGSLL
ncbi:MAG: hypothetical protein ACI3XR_10320 [Eubacteriales bacterium]